MTTRKVDVIDDFHGTPVPDPYRWLEEDNEETAAWAAEQNRATEAYLGQVEARARIRERLTELWDFPRYSVPDRAGQRYFASRNDGLQAQPVITVQEGLEAEPRTLLDPNRLSEDGTIAVEDWTPSRDGRYLVYSLSEAGSDWQDLQVHDVEAGSDLDEVIRWCKFSTVAWAPDRSGFYYSRLPEPGTVPPEDENFHRKIYWHTVGTPQADDRLIYERPDFKELNTYPEVTHDGNYLVLTGVVGTDPETRIFYRPLESDGPFTALLDQADARYEFIESGGSWFYFLTDQGAPRGRVIAIDLQNPERENWQEIIPEGPDAVDSVHAIGEYFVVVTLRHAFNRVLVYRRDGEYVREIVLPGIGSVTDITGDPGSDELLLGFTSFLHPLTTYRAVLPDVGLDALRAVEVPFDQGAIETTQAFVTSADGTLVPLFLTHRKGLELDGHNPTLLYGYGGFNVPISPGYQPDMPLWLEAGGVYAVAVLRGGSEYGEEWHRAGMLANKQNVFDDFIAAAEWLIENGYTRRNRLAINGRSNGGLLVAACMTQRPELFGAVVCEVPVIDMLRYHRFTVGHFWTGEYGNAEENPEHFEFLIEYSPLHNVRPGTFYPPTLIMTADTDDRVVPGHARKFAATLQEAHAGQTPILLRVESRAGHGHGKPVSKQIDERTDVYAFLFDTLGIDG